MNISEETIDSYLRGDLSGSELQSFDKAMASDPKLAQEVDVNRDIVDSLNNFRHQQLKSRLNAIEVPSAGGTAVTAVFLKFAASILAVAIIIGGIAYWTSPNNGAASEKIYSEGEKSKELVPAITKEKALPQPNNVASAQENTIAVQETNQTSKKSLKTSGNTAPKKLQSNSEFQDDVVSENYSPETMKGDLEMPSMNDGTLSTSIQNVKITIVKEKNLSYRFFNNQLFLHGNFSNSPYELYELNTTPNKQLYLYFEHNYYELIQGKTKITALDAITNKATLLQLNQLRER